MNFFGTGNLGTHTLMKPGEWWIHITSGGLQGLLITAFLAAFMSTIDTHLNWGASFLTIDLYKRFLNKKATETHYVKASKLFMIVLMVAGAFIATQVESVSGVMEWLAYLMIPGGIASVLRWFWWRINAYTELTALIGGLIGGITFKLLDPATIVLARPGEIWPGSSRSHSSLVLSFL